MNTKLRVSIGLILATGLSAAAWAQAGGASTDVGDTVLQEIVVTGTRLKSTEFETPNPTFSISSQSIELSGAVNMTSFLTDVPALIRTNAAAWPAVLARPDVRHATRALLPNTRRAERRRLWWRRIQAVNVACIALCGPRLATIDT